MNWINSNNKQMNYKWKINNKKRKLIGYGSSTKK